MRIFISYFDGSGVRKTIRLAIDDHENTTKLLELISIKIKIKKSHYIAKLKTDQFNVNVMASQIRVIEDWPLNAYPFRNGSWVNVDILYQLIKNQSTMSPIKKLSSIHEQLELQFEEDSSHRISDSKLSFLSQKSEYDWNHYFEDCLQKFLMALRDKDLFKMANILKSEPQVKDQTTLTQVMKNKNQFLLNQLGECGKTALHWAILENQLDIVEFLLIKSCDPNSVSLDEYTPLQLAVSIRSVPIIQTLLLHPKIDISKTTNKGSALHLAVKTEDIKLVKKILETGIDVSLCNSDMKTASQICKNEEIKKLLKQGLVKKSQIIPYITRGNVFKVTSLAYRHKERLMLSNPFQNELYLFKEKEADEKIYLTHISKISEVTDRSWLMNDSYHYLQIQSNVKLLIGFKKKSIMDHWVEKIKIGSEYCRNSFHKTKKISRENQLIENLDDEKNTIQLHKRKKKIDKNKLFLFDLKAKEEQEPEKQKDGSQGSFKDKNSQKLTSSNNAHSEHDSDSYENDLRNSQLLGSIVGGHQNIGGIGRKLSVTQPQIITNICYSDFEILRSLGNGSFGKVFLAKHRKSQKQFALKVLNKKKLMMKKQLKYAVGEASILKKINCPFVITLHYSFQTPTNLYIALDYCPYGDLAEMLSEHQYLGEEISRFYIAQLIIAIDYLHQKKIIYRDLKPENILIGRDGYIRLTDFGLSKENTFSLSFCGSPAYLSPEMLQKKGVGLETDIYGIGCVLYEMLIGQPPFFDQNIEKLFDNIKNAKIKYPSFVSKVARSFINRLLERNVKKRLGVENINEIKQHEFFQGFNWKQLERLAMKPPVDMFSANREQLTELQSIRPKFMDTDYENSSNMMNRIKGFTFIRGSEN